AIPHRPFAPIAATSAAPSAAPSAASTSTAEHLRAAQTILEREVVRTDLSAQESEALREVLFGIREHNVQRIASIYRDAFSELRQPTEALRQAYDHLERFFNQRTQ
ncbi:MAG: hypothetical protein ACXVIJ_02405, partial [Thermoanaerobaculia bacterium]